MALPKPDNEDLIRRASRGDQNAMEQLVKQHRGRLRRMIAVRMDPLLRGRVDASDLVQEVLAEAVRRLPDYVRHAPLPFYPWLRQIAWDRLAALHQRHVDAQKRSVRREVGPWTSVPDESAISLAAQVAAGESGPSGRLLREELCARVHAALAQLDAGDREILVMRHLEQLQVNEIAALLGISVGAVKMRRLRAAERLRALLDDVSWKES